MSPLKQSDTLGQAGNGLMTVVTRRFGFMHSVSLFLVLRHVPGTFLAIRIDQDSAGLEILKPESGVGVNSGCPLLAKTSYQEPDAGGVRTG